MTANYILVRTAIITATFAVAVGVAMFVGSLYSCDAQYSLAGLIRIPRECAEIPHTAMPQRIIAVVMQISAPLLIMLYPKSAAQQAVILIQRSRDGLFRFTRIKWIAATSLTMFVSILSLYITNTHSIDISNNSAYLVFRYSDSWIQSILIVNSAPIWFQSLFNAESSAGGSDG